MTTTSERSAANTIYTQSVSIIASLLVGFGLIFLFARLGNRLQIRWPDGEIHDFGEIWLYGGVSIFVVLGWTITNQFDEGLEPFNTFKQALYIALGCWVFFGVILQGCVITLLAQNIIFPAIVVSFNLLVYIALGLSIGAIQALSVKLSGFNKQQHFNLLSNTTDLETCKNGELPYRQKVYSFWLIVVSLLMFVVFFWSVVVFVQAGERSPAPYIFFGILTIFFLFSAIVIVITINSPNVKTTTGILTKSIKVVRIRYVKTPRPFLHMDNKTYRTDPSIWYAIDPGKTYTIWYLPSFFSNNENQGKVIAYEPDAPQFPKIGDKYLTSSAKKPRSKIKTNIIVGVMIGAIAIFSQFYKTRKRRM